jgi:2-polyprenyl-6-hydroxyphenyl methylase/3-demethylubiquinone-9 3-methyltransferase
MTKQQTTDPKEVEKFSKIAEEWWDEKGKFKPLHQLNRPRISYIKTQILKHYKIKSLKGLKILDVGCGGGLLSEPMARLGAIVTGLDASEKNIKIAQSHAKKSNLDIHYICGNVETLAKGKEKFDIVLNMEVVEHVANPELFLKSSAQLLKKNGLMFVATLNRTLKSFAFAKIGAEYILRWLPAGTHDWKKFLKPSEIHDMLQEDVKLLDMTGMKFDLIERSWKLCPNLDVNYIMSFAK